MAGESAGGIYIRIGADTSDLDDAVKKSKSTLGDLGGELRASATDFAVWGAAATAAALALSANFIKSSIEAADQQADLAASLRTTSASMATLERAGDVAGLSLGQIAASSKLLTLNLSKAASDGASPAAEALAKLGLTANELSTMPLDERISAINAAIKENIPITQQAAVAAELFGAKNAQAMLQLDPDVIAAAAAQTQNLGTALSEVDAAKIGAAADAFGTVGMAVDGLGKQLGAQLSPVIVAVVTEFENAIAAAGGMQHIAEQAFNVIIDGAAFAVDAMDGLKRIFEVAADTLIIAFEGAVYMVSEMFADLFESIDGPLSAIGIDAFSGFAESTHSRAEESKAIIQGARDHINEVLNAPMASEGLRQFVADAQAAGEAAAQAAATGAQQEQDKANAAAAAGEDPAAKLEAFLAEQQALMAIETDIALQKVELNYVTNEQILRDNEAFAAANQKLVEQQAKLRESVTQNSLSKLSTLMNSESRKMFEIGKAAAIGQTVYNTASAAMGAYNAMAGIPYIGPALGVAAAGAAILYGANQLQSIRNQQFGGGGGGGVGGGAAPAPASNTQNVNAQTTPVAQGAQRTTQVQGLNPDQLFSGRQMIAMINDAQRDGSRIEIVQ